MQSGLERLLFATRWLLIPFYVALACGVAALLAKAAMRAWAIAAEFPTSSESAVMLGVLGIVDLTLTASLVVIVIFSGYGNFVARIDPARHHDWPTGIAEIDFSELKLKLMASIVAIAAIKLLEAYMDVGHESDRDLYWLTGILMAFVTTALLLGLADRLGHKAGAAPHRDA